MSFAPWQFRVAHLLLPKEGAGEEECEDAVGLNAAAGRFAVADGATEAFDARRWAQTLAEAWAREGTAASDFHQWVAAQGAQLHAAWQGRALPWYVEEKARAGSFAAFVGLEFETDGGDLLRWRATALGDACLIHRRGAQIRAALPLSDPADFHACPPLVPSVASNHAEIFARVVTGAGRAQAGDTFLLLSDAAACWYLRLAAESAARQHQFESWLASAERANLVELFGAERRAGRLRDDDCAAVSVTVERACGSKR